MKTWFTFLNGAITLSTLALPSTHALSYRSALWHSMSSYHNPS